MAVGWFDQCHGSKTAGFALEPKDRSTGREGVQQGESEFGKHLHYVMVIDYQYVLRIRMMIEPIYIISTCREKQQNT